jgi:hypothetical protein
MKTRAVILGSFLTMIASSLLATSFVVPTDREMVARSNAIVTGTVEGSYVQELNGIIETVYEIRVDRSIKGSAVHEELVRVVSPGGMIGDRGTIVAGAAHFRQGDRVLVFLTRDKGRWTPTDLTLGKFRFVTSTAGDRLLVRDLEDVVGWDHSGQVHHEKVRREEGFLRFLEARRLDPASADAAAEDYTVDAAEVTIAPEPVPAPQTRNITANAAPFPGATYSSWVSNQPARWPAIASGVTFYKRVDQNIAGAADGGVSTIQNGLASWTNDCASLINLIYGGTSTKASANFDGTNVVEFNDPQSRIAGSWTGAGTVAVTFLSFSGSHTFLSQSWLNISDADVVFQNGFTASNGAFAPAMTHELGHGIGFRHSNQSHLDGGACNSATEECTSAAIMNSSVVASYGFTLQPWDMHAAESIYPGGSCGTTCTPPSIAVQPTSRTVNSNVTTTLSVTPSGTAPFSYQWYVGTSGNTASPVPGGTGSSLPVTLTGTTSYWVRVSNACGSVNSATATVTVTQTGGGTPTKLRTDFDGDRQSDIFLRNTSTGAITIWFMSGATVRSSANPPAPAASWTPTAFGDLNGDGRSDIFWRNSSGANVVWLMNGASPTELAAPSAAAGLSLISSGDYNGDGRLDLFWRNTSTGANQIWYMNGATASIAAVATIPPNWQLAGSGDFDGDGRFDVLWRDPSNFNNVLWLMKSTGTQEIGIPSVASTWFVAGTGDFNADGRSDFFWRNSSTGEDAIWLMNGATRTEVGMPTVPTTWTLGTIGDFNADGQYDVAWRNSSGSNAMWLIRNAIVTAETALPGAATSYVMYGTR